MKILFFLILVAGAGNTVLRPEIENPLTLYRILAPIGLLAMSVVRPRLVVGAFIAFLIFMIYNISLAKIYNEDYKELFPSLVHYFYLWILLVLMVGMAQCYESFEEEFLQFVKWFYIFILANLLLEIFIGSYYPNLYADDSEDGSVRAFYWNQNDLAVVVCVITWISLAYDRYRGWVRAAVVGSTLIILFVNDSKAALLSMLFVTFPVFMLLRPGRKKVRKSMGIWVSFAVFALVAAFFALFELSTYEIPFALQTYTLEDILIRPIKSILTLEPSGEHWGSINNRMDASIFVITEYLRSYGLGLGAGGSWLVLTMPQYELGGALSPHNALLQFVVDFGFPVLFGYLYLIFWAIRRFSIGSHDERIRLQVIAILSFPLLGLSQSGAIVTNYFFWAIVYFVWLQGRRQTLRPDIAPQGI